MTSAKEQNTVYSILFTDWRDSVFRLLEAAGLAKALATARQVLIKPNLVEPQKPPVTTPVKLVAALVAYLQQAMPGLDIIIAEGCGSFSNNTGHIFKTLGYDVLADLPGVSLIDLNGAELVHLQNKDCTRWPEMHLPRVAFESFLISVPVLKAHSLAGVTLTMKNMIGLAPPSHYQQGGNWKKASFHDNIQAAIFDLNRYRTPDFTLLDATIGMQEAHLWGPTCDPPPNRLAASCDPVAIDAYGCRLLGLDWHSIGHLAMAHENLGLAEPLTVREL